MAPSPPVLAIAVHSPLYRDALARVLCRHCTVITLDRTSPSQPYDLLVTDRPQAVRDGDTVLDVSGDQVVLRPPGGRDATTIGSITDLVVFLDARQRQPT